jgi:hypothetical protein
LVVFHLFDKKQVIQMSPALFSSYFLARNKPADPLFIQYRFLWPIFDVIAFFDDEFSFQTQDVAGQTQRSPQSEVFILCKLGIAPKVLNVVEFPRFPIEHMNDRIEIVHANPAGVLGALNVKRQLAELFFQPLIDIARDGFNLRIGVTLTDDEKIRGGIV